MKVRISHPDEGRVHKLHLSPSEAISLIKELSALVDSANFLGKEVCLIITDDGVIKGHVTAVREE